MSSPPLILRADANPEIGTGHFMRLWALSKAWNGDSLFVTRCQEPSLLAKLGDKKILPPHRGPETVDSLLAVIPAKPCSIVLDGYTFGPEYQRALKAQGHRVIVIDDINHQSSYECDILINPNPGAEKIPYKTSSTTRKLLGSSYAFIRDEFLQSSKATPTPSSTRKILILMGGSDPFKVTPVILRELSKLSETLEIHFVLGPSSDPALPDLNSPHKLVPILNPKNLASEMLWADVAISAAGTTALELAHLGVPTLLVSLVDNQLPAAQELDRQGAAIHLGFKDQLNWSECRKAVTSLLNDPALRTKLSENSKRLVDGKGISRLLDSLVTS